MNSVRTPYSAFPPGMPPPPAEPTTRERIDRLKALARRAGGYWKVSSLILVVGCALSVFVALRVKLFYRSETTILFKGSVRTSDRADEESPADRAQRIGAKLKDVLTTRARLETLIKKDDLYAKTVEQKGMLEAVDKMHEDIGFRARDSETYVISYENETPEVAQQVTTELADSMVAEFAKTSLSTAKQEADFLTHQEKRSSDELENANKQLATFLSLHPEFALESKATAYGPAAGTPMQPSMPVMPSPPKDPQAMGDPQLAVLYRQKARLEAELHGGGSPAAAPPTATGAPSADLVARLTAARDDAAKAAAVAQADLADKRTRLTDEHPDVISAKMTADSAARALHAAEVQLASAQSAAQPAGAPDTNPNDDANVQRRVGRINAEIAARQAAVKSAPPSGSASASPAQAMAETSELVQLETEWQRLLSVLHDVRLEHEDLKQRLERARLASSAAEAAGGDQMQVIDPAYKPLHPSKGGRSKTAMMGGVVSLLLALAYAFGRVLFDDTLIDRMDIEVLQLVPVLGVLPKLPPAPRKPDKGSNDATTKAARDVA